MGPVLAGVLQLLALIAALALAYIPLGTYMARVYSSDRHWRVERWIYKGIGADPDTEMRWPAYLRGVLAFSAAGVLFLYLLQRLQGVLPLSLGFRSIDPDQAFNTAASFVTNTNWQSYYGHGPCGADRRTGRAELRLRGRRDRRGRGAGTWVRPPPLSAPLEWGDPHPHR
jgi:K+-transporting ATPase ATPase A chain